MRSVLLFRPPVSRFAVVVYTAIVIASISIASVFYGRPRRWTVAEVPVAFWAWRTQAPDEFDLRTAMETTGARTVFLRAGQIDYRDGKLVRIRPLAGSLPKGIELHLVYKATPALLKQLENVDPQTLALVVYSAYRDDLDRARQDNAIIRGLQLDLDVPTRLLPLYKATLKQLRRNLGHESQLSITGLPTWMESSDLGQVLDWVDFWIPQFYGAEIPQRPDQAIPITSPENVTYFINKARKLERPFYAGLAAYSFALLYNSSGALLSLRGDMDPSSIAADPNLELIDQRPVDAEWRYSFRARADGVTDGLNLRAGDVLVVDVPTAESLRLAARTVRELAGRKLLGICVFRLPSRDDPATLTLEQVSSALADRESTAGIDVQITREQSKLLLKCRNNGTASSLVGSLKVDLALPAVSIGPARSDPGVLIEPMCAGFNAMLQPCSQRRANVIRFTPRVLAPGQSFSALLVLNREPPPAMKVSITMKTDTGQLYSVAREIPIEPGVNQ